MLVKNELSIYFTFTYNKIDKTLPIKFCNFNMIMVKNRNKNYFVTKCHIFHYNHITKTA